MSCASNQVQSRFRPALIALPLAVLCLSILPGSNTWAEDDNHDHANESPKETKDLGQHVHGSHPECPLPKSTQDVLRCVQEQHPAVRRAKLASGQSQALVDVAGQLPNPEVEAEAAFGNTLGDQQMDTQIALAVPFELGGKRSARKQQAKAQIKESESELYEAQAEATLQTVLKLHRLRQLEAEKAVGDEAINTFAKLVAQYRNRPRLTPEQEGSLAVFEMAQSDYKIRRSALIDEERTIEHFFHVTTGHSLSEIKGVLPKSPENWPELKESDSPSLASPGLLRIMAQHDLALADLELARANSWPDLRLGPMIQIQNEGPIQTQLYGFVVSLPLPVFSWNGGGRNYARLGVDRLDRTLDIQKSEDAHERTELVRIYQNAVESLKQAIPVKELDRKHQRLEALLLRGLLSSSLAIESHRQRADLEKTRHERELHALQALWQVYQLDGRILKETL